MANSVRKYRKFQLKSQYFGKPAFINSDDYGLARCSMLAKINALEKELRTEKNPIRRVAIQDVIQSIRLLMK